MISVYTRGSVRDLNSYVSKGNPQSTGSQDTERLKPNVIGSFQIRQDLLETGQDGMLWQSLAVL
jgi:hypothetical protein